MASTRILALVLNVVCCGSWIPSSLAVSPQEDAEMCHFGTGRADLDWRICARALAQGKFSDLVRAGLWARRAEAELQLRRWQRALESADAGLAQSSISVSASLARATALRALHRYAEAEVELNRAIARGPNEHMAYRQRGIVRVLRGKLPEAERDLSRAIELRPELSHAWMWRSISRFMRRDAGAIADLEQTQQLPFEYIYINVWHRLIAGVMPGDQISAQSAAAWPDELERYAGGNSTPNA